MRIPIVFISDDNFIMQTCVALTSLLESRNQGTWYDIHVILADCAEEVERVFSWYPEHYKDISLEICPITMERYVEIKQISHVTSAGLLKFDICELLPMYDKIIYIDGDVIVKDDMTTLYQIDLQNYYLGAVLHSFGIVDGRKLINSGVLLLNAAKMRLDGIRDKLVEKRLLLGDRKSMDQQTFNLLLDGKMKFLPPRYNCMPEKIQYEKKYYRFKEFVSFYSIPYRNYQDVYRDAAIIHYCGGEKPWKYTWVSNSKAWYMFYLQSPYGKEKLYRKNRLQFYLQMISENGFKGLYHWIKDDILEMIGPLRWKKNDRINSESMWE